MRVFILISSLILSCWAYASPPCGISYSVTAANLTDEAALLDNISSSVISSSKIDEVHLSIPTTVDDLEVGSLSLILKERGAPILVVGLSPYFEELGKQLYVFNIKREWLSNVELSAVYNEHKKCGDEEVSSSGKKYDLTKAITRSSN